VTTGKLSAVSGKRGLLIRRADVIELGKLTGHFPEDGEAGNASENLSPGCSENDEEILDTTVVRVDTERQLEIIRDTLLRPLIEQNERQQALIAGQSETIDYLRSGLDQAGLQLAEQAESVNRIIAEREQIEAEREHAQRQVEIAVLEREAVEAERDALLAAQDALRSRVSALEAASAKSPDEPTIAPETRLQRLWWQFWKA